MNEKPTCEELEQRIKELEKEVEEYKRSKKLEEELREIEYRYKAIIEGSLFAMIIHDVAPYFVTQKAAELFGYDSPEDLINSIKDIEELFKEEYRVNMKEKRERRYETKETSITELVGLRKDGTEVPLLTGINVTDWKGESAIQCTYYDIAALKQAEVARRESEERYRNVYSTAPLAFVIWNREICVTDWNECAEKMFGWSRDEVLGRNFFEFLIPERSRPQVETVVDLLLKGELPSHSINENLTRRGEIILVEWNNSILYDDEGHVTGAISLGLDITERRRAEKALRESEQKLVRSKKMESLGLLAGGVAHDLNNILSGIVSYPELLLQDLPEDSQLRKPIETMQESGNRATAIVQDLLTVARGVATTKEPLNLNDIIGEYLNSPEHKKLKLFHPTVAVKINLNTDLLNINGSPVHIRKVVMNLVSNATEAIEGSGDVTISTMNRYLDKPLMGYDDITIGEYAVLAVSDDGSGIPSDDLERIFEPFYTKKIFGSSGTGLGLAVVWNVVNDHQGYIDVKSGANGTTFELYFPITREEIPDKDLSLPIKDYQGNGETILVIDDVESQRDISCQMLDKLGYRTRSVSGGEKAIEYLKENTVDLILLDMIMDPGINGFETYERIIKIHPNQKAIIVSGFAETDLVKETQKLGAGKYIKKPLILVNIGLAVKEELEK